MNSPHFQVLNDGFFPSLWEEFFVACKRFERAKGPLAVCQSPAFSMLGKVAVVSRDAPGGFIVKSNINDGSHKSTIAKVLEE